MTNDVTDDGERLSIATVTSFNPRTPGKNSWSHTLFHMSRVLQTHCGDVTFIGPMHAPVERMAGKILDVAYHRLRHKRYMYFHSEWVARRFGKVGARKLSSAGNTFDVVIACGAVDIAYLKTNVPIVLVLDATHMLVREFYPAYTNLTERSLRELDTIERLAAQRASVVLVSSSWAARSVVDDYQVDPARVYAFPFGADIESPPAASVLDTRRLTDCCRLLFLGTNWRRKGGDLALQTLIKLGEMGIDAELVVCGCIPPHHLTHPRMRVIPFLNKRDKLQRQTLESLFLNSDFLLLPTRSDCAPMVFCEAAAFGLPVVTTDVGGVSEIVCDGKTGFTLPLAAGGDAYAVVIAQAFRDHRRYMELAWASRARFDERLNWDAWIRDAAPRIAEVARRRAQVNVPDIRATTT